MTWTYLLAKNSLVVSSPAPTNQAFSCTSGQGSRFRPGPALVSGYECIIQTVVADAITVAGSLPVVPTVGDEIAQSLADDKDNIRFLIGDTDTDDQQLQDEEIGLALGYTPNIFRAAADCADALAAKFARKANYQIFQEIREDLTDKGAAYLALARRLRFHAARTGLAPFAGGLLVTDKDRQAMDTTHVSPFFTRDMDTEPGTTPESQPGSDVRQPYY